jgi:hypothetical protein
MVVGTTFRKWTVLEYIDCRGGGKNAFWRCRCECGTISDVSGSSLRKGHSKQCKKCSGKVNGRKGIYAKDKNKKDLYMIQCGPYVKIGATSNLRMRVFSIAAANPYPTKLVGYWKDYGYMEESWHKSLKHLHHKGEWFKLGICEIN